MFCLLSAYRMPKKVEKKGRNTFRFSIIRRKIQTVFQSRALKIALLSELYGGKDAALVARMVDSVSPLVDPPVQVVAPLPPVVVSDESDEEEWETVAAVPDNRPPQVAPCPRWLQSRWLQSRWLQSRWHLPLHLPHQLQDHPQKMATLLLLQ